MKITIKHEGFHGYRSITLSLKGERGELVELSPSQEKKGFSDVTVEKIFHSLL